MKKQRKLQPVRNKNKQVKTRNPIAPPTIRHSALKGTGYNRLKDKKRFLRELKEVHDV